MKPIGINLIPRYNWDYAFTDWARAMKAIISTVPADGMGIQKIFGMEPIFTASGRSSLYAILKSLDLPRGAGVAVPLYCCHVVFDAIRQAGLVPVFIDNAPEDYNMSPEDLEKKRDKCTAVIVPHMFGHPADMESISNASGTLPIIEDCAQSLLSRYNGQLTGSIADAAFFSFRMGKYISAGEGSAVFCRDPELRKKIGALVESFRPEGAVRQFLRTNSTMIKTRLYKRPLYGTIGYPLGRRLDEKINLSAKSGFTLNRISKCDLRIINERFETIEAKINRQIRNARYLLETVHIPGARLLHEKNGCRSNYYQFPIRFSEPGQRDAAADALFRKGIDTAKYLGDIAQRARKDYGYGGDCTEAEKCTRTALIVPHYYSLSDLDLEYIAECLNNLN